MDNMIRTKNADKSRGNCVSKAVILFCLIERSSLHTSRVAH